MPQRDEAAFPTRTGRSLESYSTPKKAPPDESAAKLRKLAEDNPDDSLLKDVARKTSRRVCVRLILGRQELKRRAEVGGEKAGGRHGAESPTFTNYEWKRLT